MSEVHNISPIGTEVTELSLQQNTGLEHDDGGREVVAQHINDLPTTCWHTSSLLSIVSFFSSQHVQRSTPPTGMQKQAEICRLSTDVTSHTPRIQGQVPYEQSNS